MEFVNVLDAMETKVKSGEGYVECRGDTSEGSIAILRLRSIVEWNDEALKEWRLRHPKH